ncbi:type 1 glutamine amidotransferase domain-containing protein [Streptomyces ochraceiscleroticus]|uniref:Type 1 glutamine amidotransferase domain-containing protein n=1 Tax=Streptomyces ochraceiscleroticus TaxID=47761 RepID=A0ABW1MRZ2_9ACTN|nr:type 1 glutamine amidotransferase domain-containing protein [Streptomyces ochraceiscleroticus]
MLSAVERLSNGRLAGYWLPEAAYPWRALRALGWDFEFVSTSPGVPPVGGVDRSDPPQRMFLGDPVVNARLAQTTTADHKDPAGFDVVFVAGGHGAVLDLPGDKRLSDFLAAFHLRGGVIAAVCHGVAALLEVELPGGVPLVAGRRVTAFSACEERAVGLADVVPFFLDEALIAKGARYEAGERLKRHVVRDGTLVTGQNPASAPEVTEIGMALASGREDLPANWLRRAA